MVKSPIDLHFRVYRFMIVQALYKASPSSVPVTPCSWVAYCSLHRCHLSQASTIHSVIASLGVHSVFCEPLFCSAVLLRRCDLREQCTGQGSSVHVIRHHQMSLIDAHEHKCSINSAWGQVTCQALVVNSSSASARVWLTHTVPNLMQCCMRPEVPGDPV